MLNHCRTLLLNRDGTEADASAVAEEYVEPAFKAAPLAGPLADVWRLLFAPRPDRAFLNCRLRQYLALLHAPDLAPFTLAHDARVSYLPLDEDFYQRRAAGPSVSQTAGAASELYVLDARSLTGVQRLSKRWDVTVVDGGTLSVRHWDEENFPHDTLLGYATSAGLTDRQPLPGSPLSFYARPTVGASWVVTHLAAPAAGLAAVDAAARDLGDPQRLALFGGGDVEPYASYHRLWREAPQALYGLAGVLLAWAGRAEEARLSGTPVGGG